jgi:hypothetical protein
MPLSDGQYAKFGSLLQYRAIRTLIRITCARTKSRTASHFMTATKLENLLKRGPGSSLDKLVQHAQKMESLTAVLKTALPSDVAEHLVAANISEDGELVLIGSSPAWASRLRFEGEALLEAARQAGETVSRCRVRVSR